MAIPKKETKLIAELSKLDLNQEEIKKYTEQISSVLDNFEKLQEVKTKDVEPTNQVTGLHNIVREDNPTLDWKADADPQKNGELLLKNSPQQEDGFIKVPGVFEN